MRPATPCLARMVKMSSTGIRNGLSVPSAASECTVHRLHQLFDRRFLSRRLQGFEAEPLITIRRPETHT